MDDEIHLRVALHSDKDNVIDVTPDLVELAKENKRLTEEVALLAGGNFLQHEVNQLEAKLVEVRTAFADYWDSEGCNCCEITDDHDKARKRLGELLDATPHSDGTGYIWGSGYDWRSHATQEGK